MAQVSQAVGEVSKAIQTTSATAEQSAAASEELSAQAQLMRDSVSRFKLGPSEVRGIQMRQLSAGPLRRAMDYRRPKDGLRRVERDFQEC